MSQGSKPRARVSGSPRWLVDGMNVVGSRPDGWWRDRRRAMERLLGLLEDFAMETGEEVTVVFDGRPFPLEPGAVAVAFAPGPGPDAADREIVLRVEADADRASLRVVTSDGDLAATVAASGSEVVPAGGFRRRLEGEGSGEGSPSRGTGPSTHPG